MEINEALRIDGSWAISEDAPNEEFDLYDSYCAFCDNGGEVICCGGKCMRSFHATLEPDVNCESLGFTKEQVKALRSFSCKNCQYNIHQCFACGRLGSSDISSAAEVFCCGNESCRYFYHPDCVANLLHKGDKSAAEELDKRISAGESFTCPIHKCCVCQGGENVAVKELQFAICRRCPKSYHRKCLPRQIAFDESRAWDDLNRMMIYCLNHEIIADIGTPERGHIKFPIGMKRKAR